MISDLQSGKSITTMKNEYGSEFPSADIDMLRDLNGKLVANTSSSSSHYSSNSDSSSGCGSGCFGKIIILAIIIALIYFVMMFLTKPKLIEKTPTPAPTNTESLLDIDTDNLKC